MVCFKEKLLLVEDEDLVRWALEKCLKNQGYEVISVARGTECLAIIKDEQPALVLLDLSLPDMNSIRVLEEIKEVDHFIPVIMLSTYGTMEKAVRAMKQGADDHITKPFRREEVKIIVKRTLDLVRLKHEITYIRNKNRAQYSLDNIIGTSAAMQEIFEQVRKIAQNDVTTVLIEGESGTGKDLIAKTIHYQSKRSEYPLIEINVASLPEALAENELFGYEKGAFTQAKRVKKGLFELAQGGTILLHRIEEMDLRLQAKLLPVLEGGAFKRVGGKKAIKVDVSVIAMTDQNLRREVKAGRFREDLYYRLNVIPIHLPPLRERAEDILPLAYYFIQQYNKVFKKDFCSIDPEAQHLLMNYSWPGNVRELKNVMERIVFLKTGDTIKPQYLPQEIIFKDSEERGGLRLYLYPEGLTLQSIERDLIEKALNKTEGNQTKAAQLLGIGRDALRYRMKKYRENRQKIP